MLKKPVIWNDNNKERIKIEIDEAQKRARVRTIDIKTIQYIIDGIEKHLGVKKKALEGVRFSVDWHAQNFPSAYRYTPESTIVSGIYKKGKWRITDISRGTTHGENERYRLYLPDATKDAIIRNYLYW